MNQMEDTELEDIVISHNENDFINYLNKYSKTEIFSDKDLDIFYKIFLPCFKYQRKELFKILYKRWKLSKQYESFPLYMWIFINEKFTASMLKFISDVLYLNFQSIAEALADYDSIEQNKVVLRKCTEIFGVQSHDTYRYLLDYAAQKENSSVYNFLLFYYVQTGEYLPKPEWVKDFTNGNMPTEAQIEEKRLQKIKITMEDVNKLSNEEFIELLTEGSKTIGLREETILETKKYFSEKLPTMTDKEKYFLIRDILKLKKYLSEQDDVELFRLFGPDNPLVDTTYYEIKYRRSRMFYCEYFDFDEENNEFYDWFVGYCEQCYNRIRYRWYALRLPLPHGGFKGCFCSHKCLNDAVKTKEALTGVPDIALRVMVDEMIDDIENLGIQERKV